MSQALKWLLGLLVGGVFIWLGAADWPLAKIFEHGLQLDGRYVRSGAVLDNQARLIDLYAKMPGARRSLTNLFRGRRAWQEWKAHRKASLEGAIGYDAAALKEYADPAHGFDAEAPVHFFPELIVLLNQAQKRKTREESTLRAVDFITQRNYGIYFDIETEERMLEAGLKEYAGFKESTKKHRAKAEEPTDAESLEAHQSLVDELHPSAPRYREHIADLQSMPGMTIRRSR
jgi:hypothetical protein